MKKLSILVPVYNIEPFLKDFFESILGQLNSKVELIFCDDCSTDNSLLILNETKKKFSDLKVFKLESNSGVAEVRNFLLKQASGEYIWYVDPDDVILPNAIHQILNSIETYKSSEIIIADYILWEQEHLEKVSSFLGTVNCEIKNEDNIFLYNVTMSRKNYIWNQVYKKSLVDKISFKNHRRFQDIYYMTDLSMHCKSYVYTDQCFIKYRIRENSNTTSNKTKNYIDDYLGALLYRSDCNNSKSKKYVYGIQYKLYSSYIGFIKIICKDKKLNSKQKSELLLYIQEKYSDNFTKIYNVLYAQSNLLKKINLLTFKFKKVKLLKKYL